MKKRVKNSLITLFFLIAIVGIAALIIWIKAAGAGAGVTKQLAQCIGSNSAIYIQAGCHACSGQENIFGKNWQYLNITDCAYNPQACIAIIDEKGYIHTPTWIINGQQYLGVQSIETLKKLTGC